jgi:hypothetical protein
MEKTYKAYIIPRYQDGKSTRTAIMKSNLGASIALGKSSSNIAYLIEAVKPSFLEGWSNKKVPRNKKRFHNLVEKTFLDNKNITEDTVESFCQKHGFDPTKLIASN